MDLTSVAESRISNELETLYLALYRDKYGGEAHVEDTDRVVFRWLSSQFAEHRARQTIEAYFRLTDKFIAGKCHPIKLIRSEINQIIPNIKEAVGKEKAPIAIRINLTCDKCHSRFDWIGVDDDLRQRRLCGGCKR